MLRGAMPIQYLFDCPRYPIILDLETELVGAKNGTELSRKIKGRQLGDRLLDVIDAEGNGFSYMEGVISPFNLEHRWSKAKLIALYDERRSQGAPTYVARSLSNKPVRTIVAEIVELLRAKR